MAIELTVELVRDLMNKAIEEKGEDYKYVKQSSGSSLEPCFYVHDEGMTGEDWSFDNLINPTPGCIVGNILHRAGVPLNVLHSHEGNASPYVLDMLAESGSFIFAYRSGVSEALRCAQSIQDQGGTWAAARESFETELKFYS